jgi:hypothetical protein
MSDSNSSNSTENTIQIITDHLSPTYSNMCRGLMTSEEVILDFALNPNINGKVLEEAIKVESRVVMNFSSAKRLLQLLHAMLSRHEQTFGEILVDPSQRLRTPAATQEPASPTA